MSVGHQKVLSPTLTQRSWTQAGGGSVSDQTPQTSTHYAAPVQGLGSAGFRTVSIILRLAKAASPLPAPVLVIKHLWLNESWWNIYNWVENNRMTVFMINHWVCEAVCFILLNVQGEIVGHIFHSPPNLCPIPWHKPHACFSSKEDWWWPTLLC